jgi:exodeoxyribonuclease-5
MLNACKEDAPCWSSQQSEALLRVRQWLRQRDQQVFRLFGFAGTGKTTLAREIGSNTNSTAFCAFTGKAAHVMRQRGCEGASTIHRMIYKPIFDEETQRFFYVRKRRDELSDVKLIVVDECSMVNKQLAEDLLSFNIPTLVAGDLAQLPPIDGVGHFMQRKPDMMLTEVHRQAAQNPILRLATAIRQGRSLPRPGYSDGNLQITSDIVHPADFDVVLVGRNETRRSQNRELREIYGFAGRHAAYRTPPQLGETIVCLRNDYAVNDPVFNGALWQIESIEEDAVEWDRDWLPIVRMDLASAWDGSSTVEVPLACFGATKELQPYPGLQVFDYGYSLTVHKAQGSEWKSVLLINESRCFRESAACWLYTGITRASDRLHIVDYS